MNPFLHSCKTFKTHLKVFGCLVKSASYSFCTFLSDDSFYADRDLNDFDIQIPDNSKKLMVINSPSINLCVMPDNIVYGVRYA